MPNPSQVQRFVDTVVAGDFTGAIERFYASDAYMQENQAEPRIGRARLVADEARIMAGAEITAECVGEPLIQADRVAIRWRFGFVLPDGRGFTQEEIAWQTWSGDEIVAETFFYDPAQQKPRAPAQA